MNNTPSPTTPLILHLDQTEDLQLAANATGPVFWLSPKNPFASIGRLLATPSDFQGAWIENFRIIVQINGRRMVFEAGSAQEPPTLDLAAGILRLALQGHRPTAIQASLQTNALLA
jgi:hypothetical protein